MDTSMNSPPSSVNPEVPIRVLAKRIVADYARRQKRQQVVVMLANCGYSPAVVQAIADAVDAIYAESRIVIGERRGRG